MGQVRPFFIFQHFLFIKLLFVIDFLTEDIYNKNMKKIFTLFFMMFPLIAFSKPSFDCAKATTKVEKTICSDDELAELDLELSKVYSEKRSLANVKSSQKKWIKNRNKIGTNVDELKTIYKNRIEVLNKDVCLKTLAGTLKFVEKKSEKNKNWVHINKQGCPSQDIVTNSMKVDIDNNSSIEKLVQIELNPCSQRNAQYTYLAIIDEKNKIDEQNNTQKLLYEIMPLYNSVMTPVQYNNNIYIQVKTTGNNTLKVYHIDGDSTITRKFNEFDLYQIKNNKLNKICSIGEQY